MFVKHQAWIEISHFALSTPKNLDFKFLLEEFIGIYQGLHQYLQI